MTAYDELKKKYDELLEKVDKWESEFPGQEAEDAAKQLKAINKKAADANKEAREAKEKLSEAEKQIQETQELKQELDKWRELFPKKNPEEVIEELKKFASGLETERREHKEKLDELQKKVEEAAKKSNSPAFLDVAKDVRETAETYVNLGANVGKDSGLGVLLQPAGGLVGVAGAVGYGVIEAGAYFADKAMGDGKELVEKGMDLVNEARGDAKDFAVKVVEVGADGVEKWREGAQVFAQDAMHIGADAAENFRKGAEILTGKAMDDVTKVVEKNLNVVEEAVKGGIGFQYGDLNVGVGVGKAKESILEAKVESKDEIIKRLEKELEDKKAEIEFLRKQQTEQANKGQEGLLAVIEMAKSISRPNSPVNR